MGGGGGGGYDGGGGGGGGGVTYSARVPVVAGVTYAVVVGAGMENLKFLRMYRRCTVFVPVVYRIYLVFSNTVIWVLVLETDVKGLDGLRRLS